MSRTLDSSGRKTHKESKDRQDTTRLLKSSSSRLFHPAVPLTAMPSHLASALRVKAERLDTDDDDVVETWCRPKA